MAVQVLMPSGRNNLSTWDKIAKGLQIAESAFKIPVDWEQFHALKQKNELASSEADPNSVASKAAQQLAGSQAETAEGMGYNFGPEGKSKLLNAIHGQTLQGPVEPGQEQPNVPGLSSAQLTGEKSLLGPVSEFIKGTLSARAMAAKSASFNDRNARGVSGDYETAMKPYRGTQEDISRIESILSTKDKNGLPQITAQQMGDANAAMARIFSPNHMSDSTVSRTEYESYPAKFQAAIQKFSANPKDIGSRDLINHIIDQAHHIGNVTNQNALKELDSLDAGSSSYGSDESRNMASSKSKFFRGRFGTKYHTVGEALDAQNGGGGNQTTEFGDKQYDPDVVAYSKKHNVGLDVAQSIKAQRSSKK